MFQQVWDIHRDDVEPQFLASLVDCLGHFGIARKCSGALDNDIGDTLVLAFLHEFVEDLALFQWQGPGHNFGYFQSHFGTNRLACSLAPRILTRYSRPVFLRGRANPGIDGCLLLFVRLGWHGALDDR